MDLQEEATALIDLNVEPIVITSTQALELMDSDTILATPYSMLADTDPDVLSFLMVQDFNLQLSPMHDLHTDQNAYMSYIVQRLEDIVSVEGSHWHAVTLTGAGNIQMVFAIPSLIKTLVAHRKAKTIHKVGYVEPGLIDEPTASPRNPDTEYSLHPQPTNSNVNIHGKKQASPQFDENGNRIKRTYKRKTTIPQISTGLPSNEPRDNELNRKRSPGTEAESPQVSRPTTMLQFCIIFQIYYLSHHITKPT